MRRGRFKRTAAGGTLKVGVAAVDITPPCNVGLLMSSSHGLWAPFKSVRKPLHARILALEGAGRKVVLVSLDLLGLSGRVLGGWAQFKRSLTSGAGGLLPYDVVLACTHTHTSPETMALTGLYRTAPFKAWVQAIQSNIAQGIAAALEASTPCNVALISTELAGFSLQRRIPTSCGIKMSDSLQPIPRDWMDREPIDHRVRALVFDDQNGAPLATLGHAVCHPVHEMCNPQVSPDFPGEFCSALASAPIAGFPIYLNGTAGDVNPPTVSAGAEAAIRHGQALARAVTDAWDARTGIPAPLLRFRRKSVSLPVRSLNGTPTGRRCTAHISALRIGPVALLFLPGEIFVETGRKIESQSPFPTTLITTLCESTIGYVPTERAFREGGYEVGPGKWSFLQPAAEPLLVEASVALLQQLRVPKQARTSPGSVRSSSHTTQLCPAAETRLTMSNPDE
jgi:neutral ceramidase